MNIVVEQLTSKPNTEAMLSCFLTDMKQYFKKSANQSEDRTYARILKIAETTQKYLPHSYYISNIALKLVGNLKLKVNDKFEDIQQEESSEPVESGNEDSEVNVEVLENLHKKLSRENDAAKTASLSLGREVNQDFLKKLVFDCIDDLKDEFGQYEDELVKFVKDIVQWDSSVLVMESYLKNKHILDKVSAQTNVKFSYVTKSVPDPKKNEIHLTEVASKIRKFDRIIISAECILKNGAIVSEPGSLMVALAANKYNVPMVGLGRGFGLTEKVLIDQYCLLAENPMKYFKRTEANILKAHIAKKYDLIEQKFMNIIVTEQGSTSPCNIESQFSTYYDYS